MRSCHTHLQHLKAACPLSQPSCVLQAGMKHAMHQVGLGDWHWKLSAYITPDREGAMPGQRLDVAAGTRLGQSRHLPNHVHASVQPLCHWQASSAGKQAHLATSPSTQIVCAKLVGAWLLFLGSAVWVGGDWGLEACVLALGLPEQAHTSAAAVAYAGNGSQGRHAAT